MTSAVFPQGYFAAMRAAGIPEGKMTCEGEATVAELYGAVIEQESWEPVSGLLEGIGRDLMLLSMALENPTVLPSGFTVTRKLGELSQRVELALELHKRILDQLPTTTQPNGEGGAP